MSFFHGPGESEDNNGEGRGVTSDNALNMGEETTELVAEPKLCGTKVFLLLGVRSIGMLLVFVKR